MDIKNRKLSEMMESLVMGEMKIERNLNWQN